MKKLLLGLLLALTTSLSLADSSHLPKPRPTISTKSTASFNAINVSGKIQLIIKTTSSKDPRDTVIESKNPQWVNARVKNRTLYLQALSLAKPSRKPATIVVRMYQLNKLNVYGRASVKAKNLKTSGLYLVSNTRGTVDLEGTIPVESIKNYGPGKVNIRWVKGDEVSVYSISGNITLAGNVSELRIKLRNHAKLNAQYLRAKRVLAQTKDYSVARVLPIESLRAFANDYSNIYFYKDPQHISRHTSRSGNVLQLSDRP